MSATDRRPPYRYSFHTRVGFDETDAAGIVYYGRYMPYFDRARVAYLRHLDLLDGGRGVGVARFVMRAQHVAYHAPAVFDDELEVFVRVRRIGRTSITWEFDAVHLGSDTHLASASQTLVHVDGDRRPLEVPAQVRTQVSGFEWELES